jgi:hypothetical protein
MMLRLLPAATLLLQSILDGAPSRIARLAPIGAMPSMPSSAVTIRSGTHPARPAALAVYGSVGSGTAAEVEMACDPVVQFAPKELRFTC